jgi:hypothetical protein
MKPAKLDPTVQPCKQLADFSAAGVDGMVQRAIPRVISGLGFFDIGRMPTPDVDLLPTHLRAKIKTSETGAGDTNYIMGAGSAASQGASATIPPTRVKWSPDMRTVTGRGTTRPFGRPRMRFIQWRLGLPCMMNLYRRRVHA